MSYATVAMLASSMASDAAADDEGGAGGTATAFIDRAGNPTAEALDAGINPDPPLRSGAPATGCTWRVINGDDRALAMYDADGTRLQSETGRWLERVCEGQPVAVGGAFAVPEQNQSPVDPVVVARRARRSVAIPAPPIQTSPPVDRRLYTRVPTWLWLEPGWWRDYSATADSRGVSTSVSARPVRAVWSMGDGGTTACHGPGQAWRPGSADDGTDCSYLYKDSSAGQPDGTFTITVTVEFAMSWSSNTGAGGTLAPITRSASVPAVVGEIQAIETE